MDTSKSPLKNLEKIATTEKAVARGLVPTGNPVAVIHDIESSDLREIEVMGRSESIRNLYRKPKDAIAYVMGAQLSGSGEDAHPVQFYKRKK
jgi:hypothetical protein